MFALLPAVTFLLAAPPQPPSPGIGLAQPKPGGPHVVQVSGLSAETITRLREQNPSPQAFGAILRVIVAGGKPAEEAGRPPVAGSYSITDGVLRFEPQFPFVPGVEYRVTLNLAKLPGSDPKTAPIRASVAIPKPPPGPPTSITAVFPTANRLPENALRLYVHFSGAMARGNVYRHFKLIRDDGTEVHRPFLELDEELWSTDGLRLTILFHPGRVKRGLAPREEEGPILEEGHRYTLVIDNRWEDVAGRPLTAEVRRTFVVGPPEDRPVDPERWSLIAPRARSDAPLMLRLARPLDHALLEGMVWVVNAAGKPVAGTLTVGGGERVITFAPAKPWTRGEYRLVVDTRLEDVCGNRVGEPFEVDVFKPVERKIRTKTLERTFTVR